MWISEIAFGTSPAACLGVSASAARGPGPWALGPDVPGPLGKVLISNWYPEKSFPWNRTEITSPKMKRRTSTLNAGGVGPVDGPRRASVPPSARWPGPCVLGWAWCQGGHTGFEAGSSEFR